MSDAAAGGGSASASTGGDSGGGSGGSSTGGQDQTTTSTDSGSQGQSQTQGQGEGGGQGNTPPPAPKKKQYFTTESGERVDADSVLKELQRYRESEKRYAEISQKEKNIQAFFERLQKDPAAVLADPRLPIDRRQMAMKWLQESIQEELQFADPKDRQIHEYQQRIKEFEDRDAQTAQEKEQEAYNTQRKQVVSERTKHFETVFGKAMELSPLSKDPETAAETLRAMAIEYRIAKKNLGGAEPDPADLAAAVEKRYFKSMFSAASKLSGDDLVAFLGKEIVNKIRTYDLGQLEKKRSAPPVSVDQNWQSSGRSQKSDIIDPSELARQSRKRVS